MVAIDVRLVDDKNAWETFMYTHPEANFLHSWYWGEFHLRIGHQITRLGFYDGDNLAGIVLAIVEPARRGRHLIVPGGPILDWGKPELVQVWQKELKRLAKEYGCVFVRVRPQLSDTPQHRFLFRSLGFGRAPIHLHAELTSQLDLARNDEELKHAMRKGTRYELNRANKIGIKVETVSGEAQMDEFYKLQLKTAQRQKFVPFSKKFLTEQFKTFIESKNALLYRATSDGRLLAMAFVIFYGPEADYHYGASTDLARQMPGAYAIQWEAITEAKRRGCQRYNFWGVTGHGQTKHRFYGVSVFKRGFGGEDVAYLPAHDLVIKQFRYKSTYLFETGRRKLRRL